MGSYGSSQILQSIICKPAHEEVIQLQDESAMEGMYTVRGFAFNGGGDRIERVELSLDGGKTWRWCFRHFMDAPLRYAFLSLCFRVWGPYNRCDCIDMAQSTGLGYSGILVSKGLALPHTANTEFNRSCDVKLKELVNAFEIIVRAQDNKKMYQPEHITWCELFEIVTKYSGV